MADWIKINTRHELDQLLERASREQWHELILLGPEAQFWYIDRLDDVPIYHLGQVIDDLPQRIATLSNLTSLYLGGNSIGDEGARALATLSNLTSLELGGNSIGDKGARALLNAWCNRPNADRLKHLNLTDNDLKTIPLPAEIIASNDAQAILAAWRAVLASNEKGQLRPLNTAKLLVVGSEAVGKTSLVRYLTNNKVCNPHEKKTAGAEIHERIEISPWSRYEPGTRTNGLKRWLDRLRRKSQDVEEINVNIWDFGGQEIMHGTHRYFLTKRSLYLLVLEDRREDNPPIYDWLHIIANRAGASPIIVIINKSDNGKEALLLPQEALKRDHQSIVALHRTSCNKGDWSRQHIEALRVLIAKTIKEHPSLAEIRNPVPASWLWVKNEIAKKASAQQVVYLNDFTLLCGRVPPTERASDQDLQSEDERRVLLPRSTWSEA